MSVRTTRHLIPLVLLLGLLAACRPAEGPDLIIPTPAVTADPSLPTAAPTTTGVTATLPPPATVVATGLPATTVPATILPGTATPVTTATPLPSPTLAPTLAPPTATPTTAPQAAEPSYQVAFVAANDTLNVRRLPGADSPLVGRLPANATGVRVIGQGQSVRDGGFWLPVETGVGNGFVNSRFLTETVSREAFCADPAVTTLLSQLQTAVAAEDGKLLAELVHPDRGLRLRLSWWNEEVIVRNKDVDRLFRDRNGERYDWGMNEGSGEPVRGTFHDVMLPLLQRDLMAATQWGCDALLNGPTAGMMVLPEGYEAVRFYSAYRPAPAAVEFDWGTWAVGVEHWEGRYYISYLVHYRYEI